MVQFRPLPSAWPRRTGSRRAGWPRRRSPRALWTAGVDHRAACCAEAPFHQRHDRDLAAVEKPVADAAVRGHGFGRLGPSADARQGSGAVDQHGDPQLRTDRPVVCVGPDQRRQVDGVTADHGCCRAARRPGTTAAAPRRQPLPSPSRISSRAMFTSGISDITAMSWSRLPASAKTLCCRQHSSAARSGMPHVGGDQRGEVEDTAGAGHPLVVVRAGGFRRSAR